MKKIEDGDDYTNEYGEEFTLSLTNQYVNGELEFELYVYQECSDEELETVQDHFTVQIISQGDVEETLHGLRTVEVAKAIIDSMKQFLK